MVFSSFSQMSPGYCSLSICSISHCRSRLPPLRSHILGRSGSCQSVCLSIPAPLCPPLTPAGSRGYLKCILIAASHFQGTRLESQQTTMMSPSRKKKLFGCKQSLSAPLYHVQRCQRAACKHQQLPRAPPCTKPPFITRQKPWQQFCSRPSSLRPSHVGRHWTGAHTPFTEYDESPL